MDTVAAAGARAGTRRHASPVTSGHVSVVVPAPGLRSPREAPAMIMTADYHLRPPPHFASLPSFSSDITACKGLTRICRAQILSHYPPGRLRQVCAAGGGSSASD